MAARRQRDRPFDANEAILGAWARHNDILIYLLDQIPRGGLKAVPSESRGRTVAAQFFHLNRVRLAWLQHFQTGRRPQVEKFDADRPPTKARLRRELRASSRQVETFLGDALAGRAKVRMFGGDPVRWFTYLVAHESHHRGQILLALKQNGMRLPESVSIQGIWGSWFYGGPRPGDR